MNKKIFIAVIIVVAIAFIIIVGIWFLQGNKTAQYNSLPKNGEVIPTLVSQVSYLCDSGKTIEASYYQRQVVQSQPGEPPIPAGSVDLVLSDGRKLTLPQTISGSGIRYANGNESFIFWSKGNGAFVVENNIQTYAGCVFLAPSADGLPGTYASGAKGFSIRYPAGYSVNASYEYQELGPGKGINGVKFIIPTTMATGTNLSSFDTGVSVEEVPGSQECNANLFLDQADASVLITDGGFSYSVAEMSGAGAGNFYEEKVWAIPGSSPCIAVRYFIHSTNIGNYTPGTIKEFDKQALINQFDKIRGSLIIAVPEQRLAIDARNATYMIEGQETTLVNGRTEKEIAPASASKIITQYFGNEVYGDFNGDGLEDVAFLLTQNSGGSGTFYYIAVALNTEQGYQGTNAILLGDRIAPQGTEFKNGMIVVNYADRKLGEPFSTNPSIGVSKNFKIIDGELRSI
jgi:membrane-bound inhibitor of C-type lysozyme